jgi:superfamily I DNA/RNA helicase
MTLHEKRAYRIHTPARIVTTVHGAKNREFDNVFILWTYKLPPDPEQQRRLLYNAITRSKEKCVVLVLGDTKRAKTDPVLCLLGPAEEAFPRTAKDKRRSRSRK